MARLPLSQQASRENAGASPEAIWTSITDVEAFPPGLRTQERAQAARRDDARVVEEVLRQMTLAVGEWRLHASRRTHADPECHLVEHDYDHSGSRGAR